MADNFLQFSVRLDINPQYKDEMAALNKALLDFPDLDEESQKTPFPPKVMPLAESLVKMLDDQGYVGFQTDIYTSGYYIFTEEYGDPDMAAEWIHILMQLDIIKESQVLLEWAFTCSKPRPGEFGGGACLITKQKIYWRESADDWSEKLLKEINHAA